ncbi:MAG: UbiX family flavin prenyltransferase [Candidatus Micrarchaeia archaeon]
MKIFAGITGASGILYGKRLVEVLKELKHEVLVCVSNGAKKVSAEEHSPLGNYDYEENDFSCPYASGSNSPDAVIICPCSLKTLGEIANGAGSNLISRAAEVALKERKKLILVVRETPYSYITIKNMERVILAGGVILPASPGFYHQPEKIEDLVDFITGKILDQLGVENNLYKRWKK